MSFINKTFTKVNMSEDKPLFAKEEEVLSNTEVSNYKEFFEDLNNVEQKQSRINLAEPTNNLPFIMFQESSTIKDDKNKARTPFLNETKLSKLYFSSKNIDLVQDKIKKVVYAATKGKINIDRQSDDNLLIVMRSIYLQYGTNCSTKILEQVRALNDRVVKYCAKNITNNISMYLKYLSDLDNTSRITPYPVNPKIKGDKNNYNTKGYIGI